MKGIRNKILTIGMAAMLAGSCLGMVGCGEIDEKQLQSDRSQFILKQDVYIVHYEYNTATLHKGDIVVDTAYGAYKGYGLCSVLKLNCGQSIPTYLFNPYDTKPDESKYTHVCEECFDVIKSDKEQIEI